MLETGKSRMEMRGFAGVLLGEIGGNLRTEGRESGESGLRWWAIRWW